MDKQLQPLHAPAHDPLNEAITQALNALDDSIVIFDKHWRYVFVNERGWKVLKKSPDDVIGENVWQLLPHLEHSKFKKAAHEAMKYQRHVEIEEYYSHRREYYRTKFYPSDEYLVVQISDITEMVQARHINNQLLGNLQQAMEVYWSDENKSLRERKSQLNDNAKENADN